MAGAPTPTAVRRSCRFLPAFRAGISDDDDDDGNDDDDDDMDEEEMGGGAEFYAEW